MRAEILREREKRRAAMQAAIATENGGRSLGDSGSTGTNADPARARVAAGAARVVAAADAARLATLCKIACNAAEDAFGDTAPTFANPENAFALATDAEQVAAATRVDKRSVKLANGKVREAFFGGDADGAAVDAFVAAGFVLENGEETAVSRNDVVDARRLTLPYTADVRLVSFLVEEMAKVGAKGSENASASFAAKIARLAAPGYRKKRAVDPTKPPVGGRRAQAFVPPTGPSAAARMQLDDAFFRRDASEVAEELARAKARREAQSALTTRAWKEARRKEAAEEEASANRAKSDPVTVRVRLPDGTQLRGIFGPREPVGAVRAFVHESLREPFRRFDLAFLGAPLRGDDDGGSGSAGEKQNRKPRDSLTGLRTHNTRDVSNPNQRLSDPRHAEGRVGHRGVGYGEEGTVVGAGLAPSALITFSWAEPARPGENTDGDPRVLNDALCAAAQPLE